jgi:hypothetical protein
MECCPQPDGGQRARVLYIADRNARAETAAPDASFRKMSLSSSGRVDSPRGRPYNPPTADEAARKSANETSETFEKTKKFESSNGLLTD